MTESSPPRDELRLSAKEALALAAYVTLLRLLLPLILLRVWWRGRTEAGYRQRWWQRLGLYRRGDPQRLPLGQGWIWIHAVSLGETRAAEPLMHALRAQDPTARFLLTHMTATGWAAGQTLLGERDAQVWLPYDTPGGVGRFLRRFAPAVGVVMETEVWPNLLRQGVRAGVPMLLANARLSDKSLRRGLSMGALLRPPARAFRAVLAQTQGDAQRMQAMGAQRVQVMGNLKFDMQPQPHLLQRGLQWRLRSGSRPLVLAASTREGEELMLLQAWHEVFGTKSHDPAGQACRPRLFIVPRHPQRFEAVAQLIERQGATLARRSQWHDHHPDSAALQADVWLGDSMGEMPSYYASAAVAILGGSLAPLGGQNLIEAAACGCPIIMGESTFNFAQAAEQSLAAGAAWRVSDARAAMVQVRDLLLEQARLATAHQAALAFADMHRGAAKRTACEIYHETGPRVSGITS